MKTTVIYEDEHILIAYKPAGLATQTAKVGQPDMVSELKNHLAAEQKGTKPYLGVVHRLDQPVEGLLAFAKTKNAAASLSDQLAFGTLHKQYYAVICGQPSQMEGELVDYLYKDGQNRAQLVPKEQACGKGAKKAVLQYRILQTDREQGLAFAQICIETGRFHQIRAQMAHAGMPLLGDFKYGAEAAERSRQLSVRNVALCAYEILLKHPVTGKKLEFSCRPEGKAFSYFQIK